MTAYDSIERGAADECEPLKGRRSRTFTLTHLLVACGAVCVCAIGATTVVNTHLANFGEDSALANFDDDYPQEAQLGRSVRKCEAKARTERYRDFRACRTTSQRKKYGSYSACLKSVQEDFVKKLKSCSRPPYNTITHRTRLSSTRASGACSEPLFYAGSGIKACEDKCFECGAGCAGFVTWKGYCEFKSSVVQEYTKPN